MYLINLVALVASGLTITTVAAPSASSQIITTNVSPYFPLAPGLPTNSRHSLGRRSRI